MSVKYTKPALDTPSIDSVAVVIDIDTTLSHRQKEILELYKQLMELFEDIIEIQKIEEPKKSIIFKFSFTPPEDPFTDYIDIANFESTDENVHEKAKKCYEIIQQLRKIVPEGIVCVNSVCNEYKKINTVYLINKNTWILEILCESNDDNNIT